MDEEPIPGLGELLAMGYHVPGMTEGPMPLSLGGMPQGPQGTFSIGPYGGAPTKPAPTTLPETMAQATKPSFTIWHGTPHTFPPEEGAPFGRFSNEKIGTGEGAQAFGYGHYGGEARSVGETYRDQLAGYQWEVGGQRVMPFDPRHAVVLSLNDPAQGVASAKDFADQMASKRATYEDTLKLLQASVGKASYSPRMLDDSIRQHQAMIDHFNQMEEAARSMEGQPISKKSPGSLYEVKVNADPTHFGDLDKPLNEQSPQVQDAFAKFLATKPEVLADLGGTVESAMAELTRSKQTLGDIHFGMKDILRPPEIAEGLRTQGLPGFRYLDQGSRATGGTHNYVVFDPKIMDIVAKFGIAGALGLGLISQQVADQLQSQQDQEPQRNRGEL